MTEETLIRLGSIDGKVDLILTHLKESKAHEEGQDNRIRALENKSWYLAGAFGAIGVIAAKLGWPLIAGGH